MERKKRSKGRGWESCYVKKIYGTFGVEMRAYGQKLVKFCTHTHTRLSYSSNDFRMEGNFVGGKIRERNISRNSIRSGYLFRGRKISRKIKIREYSEHFIHAKNKCYTVFSLCKLFCWMAIYVSEKSSW